MIVFALSVWPFVSVVLFAALGREKGLIWSVVVGYLFLPESFIFNLRGLPPFGKMLSISIGISLGALFFRDHRSWNNLPERERDGPNFETIFAGLIVLLTVAAIMTIRDNTNLLFDGDRVRRGMSIRDLPSMTLTPVLAMLPFFFAWRWLYSRTHHIEVLKIITIAGLVYSLLTVYEIRMSPQFNRTVYGFFGHEWSQHVRGGGFRPLVFLQHGLWLGIFIFTAATASLALFRESKLTPRLIYFCAGIWLCLVLFLSHNLGATILLVLIGSIITLSPRWLQTRVTLAVALLFLAYPAVRQTNIIPLDKIVSAAESISVSRARSFSFRLYNEDRLLEISSQKPLFGWGTWGRWRDIDEKGRDITVSDGIWVITLGERGWVGYIAYFGIMVLPLVLLGRVSRRRQLPVATTAIGLILAGHLLYLIPNSSLSPITWLLAGAIAGVVSWRTNDGAVDDADASPVSGRQMKFSRFG